MASGIYYLACGLGLYFLVIGTLKVAPIEPGHGIQTSLMNRFAGVFPLRALGFQPAAAMYCAMTGVLEIVFGVLLAFGRYDWPILSGIGLLVLSVIGLQSRLALSDPPAEFVLPVVILALLLVLLFSRNGLWGAYRGKVHLS